jgi:epoxyqueuosine reductase
VIAPGEGSFLLLGEVVTTLDLAPDAPMEERCGQCTACIDACPTQAIVRPFVLDAGKCVATTTIELRGPVPEPLREATGEHLFGCDVCQDVCPHNQKRRPRPPLGDRYQPHARWSHVTMEDLARIGMVGAIEFDVVTEGSPVKRAGAEGLARNACLVLGRERRTSAREVLRDVAEKHPSEVVRDAARWALERLGA